MEPVLGAGLPLIFEKSIDTFREPFFGMTASLATSDPGSGASVNVTLRASAVVTGATAVAGIFPPLGNPRLSQVSLFVSDWLVSFHVMSMLWMFSGCVVS